MTQEQKFPTEIIDLPSKGLIYPKDSPLRSGQLELAYMTAAGEDILMSQNLIKKGIVIDRLLDSLIVTKGVSSGDLVIGDKNATMVAARILAYGDKYTVEVTDPETGEKINHTFNLTDCPFRELSDDVNYEGNKFQFELPVSKVPITFRLITGDEEIKIDNELKGIKKSGMPAEITTRLRHVITSVDGDTKQSTINGLVQNMLSKDSLALRQEDRKSVV